MTLRTTFGEVIEMVRNEAKLSSNTSRGIDHLDHIRQVIRRNYLTLAEDYDWQHLELKKESAVSRALLQAGLRTYAFPAAVNPLKITRAWVKWGNVWEKVSYGVSYEEFSALDPDANQRTDPVTNWQFYSDIEFEVWPLPATNGVVNGINEVAFEGQKKVEQLLADSNRLDLDDHMIVLLTAAEILASDGQKVASQLKGDAAMARMLRVRGNLGSKTRYTIGLGVIGGGNTTRPRHPDYVRKS